MLLERKGAPRLRKRALKNKLDGLPVSLAKPLTTARGYSRYGCRNLNYLAGFKFGINCDAI